MHDSPTSEIPFDEDNPRCKAHRGSSVAPDCEQCVKAAEWVAERRAARLRACGMCDGSGQRWGPETHIPVSPLTSCDHSTPHVEVLAEIAAAEEAVERARLRPRPLAPVPSTSRGRERARALYRSSRHRRGPANDSDVVREEVAS